MTWDYLGNWCPTAPIADLFPEIYLGSGVHNPILVRSVQLPDGRRTVFATHPAHGPIQRQPAHQKVLLHRPRQVMVTPLLGQPNLEESASLRCCTYAGRPFGDEEFVKAIAEPFGRPWVRGRPRKERLATPAAVDTSQLVLFAERT